MSGTYSNHENDITYIRANQIQPLAKENKLVLAIELENVSHSLKAEKRLKLFIDILDNNSTKGDIWDTFIKGFGTLISSILMICPFTLIPVHNVITNPEYWYEFPIIILIVFMPQVVAYIIINCSFWMNITYIRNIRHFCVYWCPWSF